MRRDSVEITVAQLIVGDVQLDSASHEDMRLIKSVRRHDGGRVTVEWTWLGDWQRHNSSPLLSRNTWNASEPILVRRNIIDEVPL